MTAIYGTSQNAFQLFGALVIAQRAAARSTTTFVQLDTHLGNHIIVFSAMKQTYGIQ
jgi:hypothetical protein